MKLDDEWSNQWVRGIVVVCVCLSVHSQGVMNPRDKLHQELWRDCEPRAYAFVAPYLLPWVPADTHPER